MYRVSIIVPVYNVKKYLRRCIKSLINQRFNSYEILLIDDGSTDGSAKICDEYATVENIRVFHKSNGGLSDSRNFGIERANANYISFVDSDDYVTEDYIANLYSLITANDAEIAAAPSIIMKDGKVDEQKKISKTVKVVNAHDMLKIIFTKKYGIGVSAWAKLYAKHLFDDIKFPLGKSHEDLMTVPFIIDRCERIVITDKADYFYCIRENSITTQKFNLSQSKMLFEGLEKVDGLVERKYSNLNDAFICRYVNDIYQIVIDKIIDDALITKSEKVRIIKNITFMGRKKWYRAIFDSYLTFRRRIYVIATLINPMLYDKVLKMKNRIKLLVGKR